ncbi:SusC/RagA family TonB-linked outer membrane protein [Flavobacterium sp.]|jgi:TonB-linked SusC/RagA family outer membrane protein|uniref:SusC/RagA family TonB-linked outer membrane protein n=1 Tax=Flavobacterium sp. TaxID=239 RepID=UPI0037C0A483
MRSKFKWIFTLLVAFTMQFSFAQQKTVTGTVTSDGAKLPGATVSISGTQQGTQTDENGKFSIKAAQGDVLEVSFLGKDTKTVKIGAGNVVNVVLSTTNNVIQDVVVQGYRTVTKKSAVTADASVSAKTIENRPNANAMNTLQGQLAGVNITASTGQPGAKSSVVIRGIGSINGNSDPLYVIDGFPSNSDSFRTINSNDIESIAVLKDAAATSEYGNRGSNGVIVVKTKKAKFGDAKTSFRYSSQYGVGYMQLPKYTYANAKELLKIEQNFGAGLGATLTDAEIAAYGVDTDWVGYFFRPSTSKSHNLSVENSNKNIASFTSLGYFDQDGILESTGIKRFNLRNNINGKSSNDKFKYQINTGIGFSKNAQATNLGEGAINRNYVTGAFLGAPYVSTDVYQGSQSALDYYNNTPGLLATPIMLMDKLQTYTNLTDEIRIDVATDFAYSLTKNLTFRSRLNGQLLNTRFNQAEFPNSFNALLFQAAGQTFTGFEDIQSRREFLFNNLWQVAYNKQIGNHTFNISANAEYNNSRFQSNNFRQRGLIAGIFIPDTGAGYAADTAANDFYVPQISAGQLRNDLISYFGSVDYDFSKKYGVVASIRRDGTSRFIDSKQWGNFWSVGGRWNIDEEAFMDNAKFIDVLKLRGSYGTVGNQRIIDGTIYAGINPPAFADIYSVANNTYNGGTGYGISFGFPDLQWETTTQSNVGLDFEMFKTRLKGSLDVYNKVTSDLFLAAPVSATSGTTSLTKNTDASLTNKGVELNLAYDLIRNQEKEILLTIKANGSYNDNTVDGIKSNGGVIFTGTGPTYITENGGSLDAPFVYHYIGVNPANGNLLFEDKNGNPTETPTAADRKSTNKNYMPSYQGGFGFDFSYKGFFTSALFTYAFDVWRFDIDLENLYDPSNLGQFVVTNDMLNAWTPTNTNTQVPALNAANIGLDDDSDRFLRDASYIRLRNVQVGYRMPSKFLKDTFIKDLSFTLQAENLFNITKWQGFDPESDRSADFYQYPTPRLFTFGLDVKF